MKVVERCLPSCKMTRIVCGPWYPEKGRHVRKSQCPQAFCFSRLGAAPPTSDSSVSSPSTILQKGKLVWKVEGKQSSAALRPYPDTWTSVDAYAADPTSQGGGGMNLFS